MGVPRSRTKPHFLGNGGAWETMRRNNPYITDTFRNIRNASHGIKGDHAGSDASIGVTTSRSLNPVKSME